MIDSESTAVAAVEDLRRSFDKRGSSMGGHPWQRLPNELLARIFIQARDLHPWDYEGGRNPIPNVVSSVCRPWRSVANATPRLWSDLPDWDTRWRA